MTRKSPANAKPKPLTKLEQEAAAEARIRQDREFTGWTSIKPGQRRKSGAKRKATE